MQPNKNYIYNYFKTHHLIDESSDSQKIKGISKDDAIRILGASSEEFDEVKYI